jgi:ketosteroid isomerase-like protein
MSDPGRRSGEVTAATLEELLDAFNQHDLDRIMEFFSDDATFDMPRGTDPWGTRYVGKDEVRKGLASRFSGIPDVQYAEDRHWVSGDRAVSEWLLTGTSTSGEKIRVRGCDLFEIRDGKIIRKDSYWKIVG